MMSKLTDHDRPLIAQAEERTREIHALCVTVERACAAIGFTKGSCGERVAVLVAKVAGSGWLNRTAEEIASDKDVAYSAKQVRRVTDVLARVGVIEAQELPAPDWHSVGRPPRFMMLRVCWDRVREVVAKDTAWRQNHAAEVIPQERFELGTSSGHDADIDGTSSGHDADIDGTLSGHLPDHSYVLSPIPSSPSPGIQTATGIDDGDEVLAPIVASIATDTDTDRDIVRDAVVSAGVERVRQLLDLAIANRITDAELIDAAYVVQHWDGLTPGALFDWARSGGFPKSGVPPADVLRDQRRDAAERIRSSVRADASNREIEPPPEVVAAVICKRLRATQPKGCKTDLGDEITAAELRGEAVAMERRGVSYAER